MITTLKEIWISNIETWPPFYFEEGNLEPKRLESYFKQKRELNKLSEKTKLAKKKLINMRKRKSKELSKLIRARNKLQDKIQ